MISKILMKPLNCFLCNLPFCFRGNQHPPRPWQRAAVELSACGGRAGWGYPSSKCHRHCSHNRAGWKWQCPQFHSCKTWTGAAISGENQGRYVNIQGIHLHYFSFCHWQILNAVSVRIICVASYFFVIYTLTLLTGYTLIFTWSTVPEKRSIFFLFWAFQLHLSASQIKAFLY